jgi:integration host factor subunit beta
MNEKVTKGSLVKQVSEETGCGREEVRIVIERCLGDISAALVDGDRVELRGFGAFSTKIRKARKNARNPRTGEPVKAVEHRVAWFKPGTALRESVRNEGVSKKGSRRKKK